MKVPSEILYSADGTVRKWGYQLKVTDERTAWFKLLLQPTDYGSADCSMAVGTQKLTSPKKPVDIVADYLSCLRLHFLEIIGGSLGKAFLDATPIDYTVTVPAVSIPPPPPSPLSPTVVVNTTNRVAADLERPGKGADTRGCGESGPRHQGLDPADV